MISRLLSVLGRPSPSSELRSTLRTIAARERDLQTRLDRAAGSHERALAGIEAIRLSLKNPEPDQAGTVEQTRT